MQHNSSHKTPQADLLARGLTAKRSWGQNFLRDTTVLDDIVNAIGVPNAGVVVELGAGLGALTRELLAQGFHVVAVERDRDLIPALTELASEFSGRLTVLEQDASHIDYVALQKKYAPEGLTVVGNLPYQLSSRLLVNMADAVPSIAVAVAMIQKEVAERIVATPGGRDFGLLTVLLQRRLTAELIRDVSPNAFYPKPKVTSSVIRLTQQNTSAALNPADDWLLCQTARLAFSSRRKMLRRALLSSGGLVPDASLAHVEAALVSASVSPEQRAETLDVASFLRIGQSLVAASLLKAPQ